MALDILLYSNLGVNELPAAVDQWRRLDPAGSELSISTASRSPDWALDTIHDEGGVFSGVPTSRVIVTLDKFDRDAQFETLLRLRDFLCNDAPHAAILLSNDETLVG